MRRSILAIALLLCILPLFSQGLTLKIAAYVPPNSPWDIGLKKLAAEFETISAGRVKLAFPQSLKGASEADIIQKLKLGLDGALLTSTGMAEIYPDILALSLPSVITTDAELDVALETVRPLVSAKLSERYAVLAFAKAGWLRYYSTSPIVTPEDLGKLRVSIGYGDDTIMRLFQTLGTRTVKGDWSGLFLQLSSKSVDAFYTSPVFVSGLWSQFKGKVSYMSPFKAAPFFAALVFSRSAWDKVPADLKPKLEAAAEKIAREMAAEGIKLEDSAVEALRKEGMILPPYPQEAAAAWRRVYSDRRNGIIAELFSSEILTTIDTALAKARSGK